MSQWARAGGGQGCCRERERPCGGKSLCRGWLIPGVGGVGEWSSMIAQEEEGKLCLEEPWPWTLTDYIHSR